MPGWFFVSVLALIGLALLIRQRRKRVPSASAASPQDRALTTAVFRANAVQDEVRPTPVDARKRQARRMDGPRVRLAGAVVDGELSRAALETILIERQNIGEQAKAVRILLQFFPLPEAVPVLTRALQANDESFLHLARFAFGQCGMGQEIGAVMAAVSPADEPWLLGALLFADPFSQRSVSDALARVGGRRSLDALRAMARTARPTPWIRDATDTLRDRLRAEQAGGLAMAPAVEAEGGVSCVDEVGPGGLSWSDQ